jgi:pSer/pThr/pTyr-binding forkhead associated (FHA) protein
LQHPGLKNNPVCFVREIEPVMIPRLRAVAGPLQGAVFPIAEKEFSIGRDIANSLCLSDPAVSRHHCLIKREGQDFLIIDLESVNSTLVNGVAIKELLLRLNDQIGIGESLFVFLESDAGDLRKSNALGDDGQSLVPDATVELRLDDALFKSPEKK